MASSGAVVDSDVLYEPMAAGRVALVLIALAMGGFAIGVTEFAAMSILPDFAAGYGWASTGWVGMGLSLGGFAIFVIAWLAGRKRAASERLA